MKTRISRVKGQGHGQGQDQAYIYRIDIFRLFRLYNNEKDYNKLVSLVIGQGQGQYSKFDFLGQRSNVDLENKNSYANPT